MAGSQADVLSAATAANALAPHRQTHPRWRTRFGGPLRRRHSGASQRRCAREPAARRAARGAAPFRIPLFPSHELFPRCRAGVGRCRGGCARPFPMCSDGTVGSDYTTLRLRVSPVALRYACTVFPGRADRADCPNLRRLPGLAKRRRLPEAANFCRNQNRRWSCTGLATHASQPRYGSFLTRSSAFLGSSLPPTDAQHIPRN